jgi:hypothetical protein
MPVQLSTKADFRLCIFYSVNRIISSFHTTAAIEMSVLNSAKPHAAPRMVSSHDSMQQKHVMKYF